MLAAKVKMFAPLYAGLILSVSMSRGAFAAGAVDLEVTADFYGKYIWRGQNISDDPVFQTSFSASYKSLTATVWGNLELTNVNDKSGDFSEMDYSLDYSAILPGTEGLGYCLGAIYYDFHSCTAGGIRCPDTIELYWGLSLDWPLSPSVTIYHDVDEADGAYVSAGLSCSIKELAELGADMPIGLQIGAGIGWGSNSNNKYYWTVDGSKLDDLSLSLSLPIELSGWTVKPHLNYTSLLSNDIRDADIYGSDSDFLVAGVGLSKRF